MIPLRKMALATLLALASCVAGSQTYSSIYTFSDGPYGSPQSQFVSDSAGNLYANDYEGTVIRMAPPYNSSTVTVIGHAPGHGGRGPLAVDANRNVFGSTIEGGSSNFGTIYEITNTGQTIVLYNFTGGSDGGHPSANVAMDAQGNLYGATANGGDSSHYQSGIGVVFKVSPPTHAGGVWTESVLYQFSGMTDGGYSSAGVLVNPSGTLIYGTVIGGGDQSFVGEPGAAPGGGVVFSLKPPSVGVGPWTEQPIYSFHGGADGWRPEGGLTMDKEGNLLGMTSHGGDNTVTDGGKHGAGVVYKLAPPTSDSGAWKETVLYTFHGGPDGGFPLGGVTVMDNGDIFGATPYGGDPNLKFDNGSPPGGGVAFELTAPSGSTSETVLHTFNGSDSAFPVPCPFAAGSLLLATAGDANGYTLGASIVYAIDLRQVTIGLQANPIFGSIASTGTLTMPAPSSSDRRILLTSSDTHITVPSKVTMPAGQKTASFKIATAAVKANRTVQITASYDDSEDVANVVLTPETVVSIAASPNDFIGGGPVTCTVLLNKPAEADYSVALTSASALVQVPASVVIPSGKSSATFTASTFAGATITKVIVSASFGGLTEGTTLTVRPARVGALALSPTTVVGGTQSIGVVLLDGVVTTATKVTLSSALAQIQVPASITVPAGASSASFTADTDPVLVKTSGLISATLGATASAKLTLVPATFSAFTIAPNPVKGGVSTYGTVVMSGPVAADTTVTISNGNADAAAPKTVTIPAGASSAMFTIATGATHVKVKGVVSATIGTVARKVSLTISP